MKYDVNPKIQSSNSYESSEKTILTRRDRNFLVGMVSMRRYSCMIQLVLRPFGGLPLKNTSDFFTPTFWDDMDSDMTKMGFSVPVAFQ